VAQRQEASGSTEEREVKRIILTVKRRGDKPIGVVAQYANHKYIGSFRLTEAEIKALKVGQIFQGHRIKEVKR
jgi:histidinol dehydrogenase